MLDTTLCKHIIKEKPDKVLRKLQMQKIGDVVVSAITVSELARCAFRSNSADQNKDALNAFLIPLEIMPFDHRAAFQSGEIRSFLDKKHICMDITDVLVTSHAMSLSLILVTNQIREFRMIPNLQLESWL
jgi:tRNA(fMet)-specific endonuclease VapC